MVEVNPFVVCLAAGAGALVAGLFFLLGAWVQWRASKGLPPMSLPTTRFKRPAPDPPTDGKRLPRIAS